MAAPAVQSIQDIINSLNPAYAGQRAQIDDSLNTNESSGTAQVAGIEAAKKQAFSDIDQTAQNRGMLFSGFSPDQDAKYTGTTYLPALANLQATIAKNRATLLGQKSDIDTKVATDAFNTNQDQQKELASYNTQQDQNAFTASENAKNRAASAAAAASAAPSAAEQKRADVSSLANELGSVAGRDGYISPQSWQIGLREWVKQGYSATDYVANFKHLANPADPQDYSLLG